MTCSRFCVFNKKCRTRLHTMDLLLIQKHISASIARAQILARRRESEGSEVLRSPDPVVSELEISWASGEREELECTKNVIDEDVMKPERGTATTTPHPWGRILCTICCAQYHTWCYAYCKSCSIERKSKP